MAQSRVFMEDSDGDSINTTSTAESDFDDEKEFEVETVLAEQPDQTGTMQYLVEWQGYPLHACTWEPQENILNDIILTKWSKQKLDIQEGRAVAFNVEIFEKAVEDFEDKKADKKRRRIAKRRRRGETITSPDEEEDEYQASEPEQEPEKKPKRTKVQASPVDRKGVAKPVLKRRVTAPASGVDRDSTDDESDSDVPLSGARKKTAPLSTSPTSKKRVNSSTEATALKNKTASTTTGTKKKPSADSRRPSTPAVVSTPKKTISTYTGTARPTGAGRKSAPSAPNRPAPANVFAGDWTAPAKRKERPRVSGETPKDSTAPKFRNLSTQNRFQKYGAQNERAPDPNAVATIDPKTGKVEPPKAAPSAKIGPTEIPSAYGRGRSPPPTSRKQSEAPKIDEGPTTSVQPSSLNAPVPPNNSSGMDGIDCPELDRRKQITCKHWQEGHCKFVADECVFAHAYTPILPTKQTTCRFWNKGHCNKTDDECDFAHWDTGVVAGKPGTFKRRFMAAGVHTVDLPGSAASQPFPNHAPTMMPPKSPFESPSSHIAQAEILRTHSLPGFVEGGYNQAATDRPSDPRLAGRTPRTPTAGTAPTPVSPVAPAQAAEGVTDDFSASMDTDSEDSGGPGSIEEDLIMAQRGIQHLDSNRLLTAWKETGTQIVERVLIHMPPERHGEADLLVKYFEGLRCKVLTTRNAGTWDLFRKNFGNLCLLVVHPTEDYYETLPGLSSFVMNNGSGAQVFSIGVQYQQCLREDRASEYGACRLFPHGGMNFITDDVFVYYPEKALEIIEKFLENTKNKPPGGETSKIGARPGIKQWLSDLAREDCEKQAKWIECHLALCRLCPFEDEEPDIHNELRGVPSERSHLWSLSPDTLKSFKGRWESGDEEGATDYMANLFAGTAIEMAWKFRKFVFVYQRPDEMESVLSSQGQQSIQTKADPKGWMKKYNQISVMTPDALLNQGRKTK